MTKLEARKLVPVRMTVYLKVEVPDDWDDDAIEFFLNESSHCSNNEVRQLADECDRLGNERCFCSRTSFVVDREWWEKNQAPYEDDEHDA